MNAPFVIGILVALLAAVLVVSMASSHAKHSVVNAPVFVIGIAIDLLAALLLVLNVIETGVATVLGIIGIGLIATSGTWARGAQH